MPIAFHLALLSNNEILMVYLRNHRGRVCINYNLSQGIVGIYLFRRIRCNVMKQVQHGADSSWMDPILWFFKAD